jgi:polyhydroxyalkanoate synthesis regulator phasin
MMSLRHSLALLLFLGLFVGQADSRAADYLYRYINDEGVTVINYSIPPQFVHKGYEILNRDGSVHKVVPRSLTDAEMADRSSKAYQDKVAAEEAERLRKWDESLLLRYSSIEDIEAARERSLSELRIRISILRSNVRSLKNQVQNNQARAADIERSGGTVPVELVSVIDGLQSEIGETERSIKERLREIEVVDQGFQRDIDRFALLLDKVELRNRYSRPGTN